MMEYLRNFKFNIAFLLSITIMVTGGCKWLDDEGHYNPSENEQLASLTVSEGSLSPSFDVEVRDYSVDVDNTVDSIQVTASLDDERSSITINGIATASGDASAPINLSVGDNAILIVVRAETGDSRTITITVTRADPVALSNDATLGNLTISQGDFVPAFDINTISYGVSVANAVDSVTVTPSAADQNATILVNNTVVNSGSASGAKALVVGDNVISVVVTAEDGTTENTYTVTVTRDDPLSADADLGGLSISSGSLTPAFASTTFGYTASVAFGTTSVTVTPVLSDTNATVTVNASATASGTPSASIDLMEGENTITLIVLAEDGTTNQTYTITVTRQAAASFAQEAYIKASNTDAHDSFGWSVAISGNTMAVGARWEASNATGINNDQTDNSIQTGAVYVFVHDGSNWSQQAYLKSSVTGLNNNQFGYSVDLFEDTLAVGAIGESSNARGIDGDETDTSSPWSGAVYVFTRDTGGNWSQQAYIKSSNSDENDSFGRRVSLSENTLAVSSESESSSATGINGDENDNSLDGAGAVYIFARSSGNTWSQQAYIKASNTNSTWDIFGTGVALSGDTLVVGASGEDSNGTDQFDESAYGAGAAYVFTRDGTSWSQQAYIKASNVGGGDAFGTSVAISGDTLVVGALRESSNATSIDGDQNNNLSYEAGAAYVFTRAGVSWSQQAYLKTANSNFFGSSVAISGDTIVVGAYFEDSNATGIDGDQSNSSASNSGAAYKMVRDSGGNWSQQSYIKASNSEANDKFAYSVAASDIFIVIGADGESSIATDIGGDQGDNSAGGSGAAYVFKTQ